MSRATRQTAADVADGDDSIALAVFVSGGPGLRHLVLATWTLPISSILGSGAAKAMVDYDCGIRDAGPYFGNRSK